MIHCIIWRKNIPHVVSFRHGLEVSSEAYESDYRALAALYIKKGGR